MVDKALIKKQQQKMKKEKKPKKEKLDKKSKKDKHGGDPYQQSSYNSNYQGEDEKKNKKKSKKEKKKKTDDEVRSDFGVPIWNGEEGQTPISSHPNASVGDVILFG